MLAERTGLEPATSGVTGQHSNQLNYRSALFRFCLNHPWLIDVATELRIVSAARAVVTLMASPRGFEPRSPP